MITQAPTATTRRLILVDRPGAVQADIRYGGFGTDRLDPRWSDITVAGYAMGGAFLSRLNAVLREDKGYTTRTDGVPPMPRRVFRVQGAFRTEVGSTRWAHPGADRCQYAPVHDGR